ncbi:MAG: thiamine diphosphokinase [Synergistaceae bacterium]|nr:thiamine diphosphokinase [Synergistaceae bacterium]
MELDLPQVRAASDDVSDGPARLLVLGGRAPDPDWLRAVADGRETWAVDAGMDACVRADVCPSRLMGDLDSVSSAGRSWAAARGVATDLWPKEKDATDFQLALDLADGDVLVTGCWGGRFDHAWANAHVAISVRGRGARVVCLADDREALFPLVGPAELRLSLRREASALSLLPMTETVRGTRARGVRWPLDGATLRQGSTLSHGNVPRDGEEPVVSLDDGTLGVYLAFP